MPINQGQGHPLLAVLAAVCILAPSPPARAQDALIRFHVAAGPAALTIPEFARQANIAVLANGEDLAGKTTAAVQGSLTLERALDALLAGTGLLARANAGGRVLIEPGARPSMPPAPAAPQRQAQPARVLVAGTRASQRDSIERKKIAATALDAIVAEDVGEFPDRNVAEAISRLAGVTLERGEYGEGTTINVRGVAASQTRVEIDGLGVQAGGGTDLNNGGSGRGVELRELPADLIKSIDVVKGATADMTEGSLGGAVVIHTRTGLDFKRRYVSLRAAAQQNTINRKWTPNLNYVFADQFLDKRLGMVLNLSSSAAHNENHTVNISPLSNGPARDIDFDGSPDKTFSFNPSTVSQTDPAATAPMARWATTGGGSFDALSPLEIVTRSAQAATRADCYTAFPLYSNSDVAAIASSVNRAAAKSERASELHSCLNQWNDYTPANLRYQIRREFDRRVNADLRFDFKVDPHLSLYAKFDGNRRRITDEQLFLSLGGISINADGSYADAGSGGNLARTPLPGSGYYFYPTPSNLGASGSTWRGLTDGSVVNVLPDSIQVDANHHLTQYTLSNAALNEDQIYDQIATGSSYAQFGGAWRDGRWRADFLAGRASAWETRMQWRTNFGFDYGPATVTLQPDGLWTYSTPPGTRYDQTNLANYGVLQPQAAGLPLVSAPTQLTLADPLLLRRSEDTAKLDMAYAVDGDLPFLGWLRFGLNRRDYTVDSWTGAGYTVRAGTAGSPAVVVPREAVRSSFQACENTAASIAAGGTPCKYGTTFGSNPANVLSSSIVMSQDAYRNIVAQALGRQTAPYFNSLPDRPAGLPDGWTEIDVPKVIALTGVQNFNLDCVRTCLGSDGTVYEQPRTGARERTLAAYLSTDFAIDRLPFTTRALPFGWRLDGNVGWRVVRTGVAATGLMTFQSIARAAAYDPLNPNAAAGITTATLTRNTTLRSATTDVMPILNLAWWPIRDRLVVRYNKAKAIARPPVEYLYTNGATCTYDERKLDTPTDMSCSDTLGNPGLRAATNRNYNLSLEWYPNRNSLFSLTRFRQEGLVGAPIRVAVSGFPFAASGTRDPASGADLTGLPFTYATYVNGPASERDGFELSAKTAFTVLPSFLRHTGLDLNYTHAMSTSLDGAVRDLVTGDVLAPPNELAYTWNASLWYDDGKFQARVALQGAASFFRGMSGEGRDYPANGVGGTPTLAFNPSVPTFRDARRFLDAKVSYRFANGIELFAEGRNLGRSATTDSLGGYQPFANGTPELLDYVYTGAQYMIGLTYRH